MTISLFLLTRGLPAISASFLLAACAMGTSAPAEAADVCTKRGEAQSAEIRYGDSDRSYRYFVPKNKEGKLPLVVAMHGGWGTGEALADQTGMDAAAERHGFAVVYPNGVWRSWNAGSCCGRAASTEVDDVGFIRTLTRELGKSGCIDEDRVYGTGFSNGAMLTHRIACEAPEVFDAIAPVAGGPMIENCPDKPPMPALLMVGRQDERIPWDGGTFDETYRPSISEQVKAMAQRNRCEAEETKVAGNADACAQRKGCGNGALRWCVFDGVGHQWPGGKTIMKRLLGPNRDGADATDTILNFFAEQK